MAGAAAVSLVKGLNCPNCGAALAMRAAGHALTVVCEHCNSILDAKDPNFQVLQKFEAKVKVRPFIPLGSRGEMGGVTYEAIGFQVRTIVVDSVSYSWREYLLFNPYKGFRYLTEYDGHWNSVRTLRSVPEPATARGKPAVMFAGQKYSHFQTSSARTTYVLGEFPWQVRVGEKAEVKDHIAPPRILSSETTVAQKAAPAEGGQAPEASWSETVWSLGAYIPGAQVWQTFKLPGSAPVPKGVFASQPSPYQGRVKSAWKLCAGLLFALILMALFFSGVARREQVFQGSYTFNPRGGENSYVTEVFELKGRASTVELAINTDLSNNWAYFSFALINDETGEAYDFGREVSYYFGRDSDGSWSEGSAGDTALIPSVPPGRYYLRVEPELGAGAVTYALRVRRDVPSGAFYWFAAVLLLIPPVFLTVRAATFEARRWQESDYAGSSSDDDDDE